jgi:uncharacterized protein (TIRG00374 family)
MILIGAAGKSILLFSVAGIIFAGSLLFFLLGHKLSRLDFMHFQYLKNIIFEWESIRKDVKTLTNIIFLSTFMLTINGLIIYLSFAAFSINVSFVTSWTIATLTTMTGVMNLVPGNIGIREAIIIAISGMSGISINEGAHAAVLGRILLIFWTFLLVPFFSYHFFRGKNLRSEAGSE